MKALSCGFAMLMFGASAFAQTDANPTARVAEAANAFLSTLNDDQRTKVQFEFKDKAQRARWSNLPLSMAERRGLLMGDLTREQRAAALRVLAAALSPMGYEKIKGVVESNEALRGNNANSPSGRDKFVIAFLGKPSATSPWMLQFGGHHLGLNVTFAGREGTITPSLIAVQPARFEFEGKTIRPLGRETDKAFELVTSLDSGQRKQAVLGFRVRDLALGPGRDDERIQPEGIPGSALTPAQREMLLEIIGEWARIIHETAAEKTMAEAKANLADTWFAWSGPLDPGGLAYFRVQGPTVVIEFAPQTADGQHIHTVYRDFTNDYGKKFLGQ